MQEEMVIVFRISNEKVKEKISKIRKSCLNLTELFIKWVMDCKIENK